MDFTFLVQNIITKYMTNLDEKGYEEPRKIVFDGLYNDLQYVYRCGQLSRDTGVKQELKQEIKEDLEEVMQVAIRSPDGRDAVEKLAKENHMRLKEYESGWGY